MSAEEAEAPPKRQVQKWEDNCTPQLAAFIVERVLERGSVHLACKDPDMPTELTFKKLMVTNQYFRDLFREAGAAMRLLWAMEVVSIAEGSLPANKELGHEEKGKDTRDRIARDQLRVSARIQLLNTLERQRAAGAGRPLGGGVPGGKGRTPVEGAVTEEQQPAEDPKQMRYEMAKFLEAQKERLGSDSIADLIQLLTSTEGASSFAVDEGENDLTEAPGG